MLGNPGVWRREEGQDVRGRGGNFLHNYIIYNGVSCILYIMGSALLYA